ncbi:Homeobox protein Meis3, partial [Cyphomyrmex costatus]
DFLVTHIAHFRLAYMMLFVRKQGTKRSFLPSLPTCVQGAELVGKRQREGHPYPSEDQKKQLAQDTGLTILQVNNWQSYSRRYPLNFFPLRHRIVNIITVRRGGNLDRLTAVMLEMVELKETDWPPRRFTEEPLNRHNAFIIAALSFILYAKKRVRRLPIFISRSNSSLKRYFRGCFVCRPTEDGQPRMFQEYLQNGIDETMVLATRKA